ncbi:MAG: slipin family protein [Erysipelotrichaceae bacterium]
MKIVLNENQKGLLFKNGKFIDVLSAGKHHYLGNSYNVIVCNVDEEFILDDYPIETFIRNESLKDDLIVVDIPDVSVALHYEDEKFVEVLTTGKHAFWNTYKAHFFKEVSIEDPQVDEDIPKHIFSMIPDNLYFKFQVLQFQKGRLYYDGKIVKQLDEGMHYFWNNGTKIVVESEDTRLLQMDITGQEILTLDKVALRINFVCHYKITDFIKIRSEIDNYKEQLHVISQLALRDYIGRYRLDEILTNKDMIASLVLDNLKEKEKDYFINIYDAGIKDIILPGEIRDIMNTLLVAEKRAQANVITRREEVASTRSLLNTARLMDENATLYKLKELECLEKICENVGNITVGTNSDLLAQLSKIIKG